MCKLGVWLCNCQMMANIYGSQDLGLQWENYPNSHLIYNDSKHFPEEYGPVQIPRADQGTWLVGWGRVSQSCVWKVRKPGYCRAGGLKLQQCSNMENAGRQWLKARMNCESQQSCHLRLTLVLILAGVIQIGFNDHLYLTVACPF